MKRIDIPAGLKLEDITEENKAGLCSEKYCPYARGAGILGCKTCVLSQVTAPGNLALAKEQAKPTLRGLSADVIITDDVDVTEEHTGGSSSYYMADIKHPTTQDEPYMAECNDIIEALDMTFAEGNAFKAIWRTAAARLGKTKKGNNALYDAEKVCFFGERMKVAAASD